MTSRILSGSRLAALALIVAMPCSSLAAESYDNCTGFITSLPAVIANQGTWCLKQDLATAITNGQAITIATNNVTIDCNNFKLGGLTAGTATETVGIDAVDRLNVTVRHCNIRGFFIGVLFNGTGGGNIGGGHVVEDNRFDGNTYQGIHVGGDGSVIRRNLVLDTGGSTDFGSLEYTGFATGIAADYSVDIQDNAISGLTPTGGGWATGIATVHNSSGSISRNRVRGLLSVAPGINTGIDILDGDRVALRDNDLVGDGSADSNGLLCDNVNGHAKDNVINGFATGISGCTDDGNVIAP